MIIYGAHVRSAKYVERISHYNILSTLLAMYGLPGLAGATPNLTIRDIWD